MLAQPEDAGVVRIDEETHRGIALALDGNARYARLDPYAGAQLNLAEAYRNVAVSGAKPLAVTNCLNFGSPEEPEVMWQFAEAVRGLADGCRELGLPVTGGNVSLYNQTGDVAINPTPVIGVLGVHEDVRRRVPGGWRTAGETVLLLGETRPEFGGSAWATVVHGHLGGRPPAVDLPAERALGELLAALGREGLVSSAHDLADGGLAQTLAESALRYGVGARLQLAGDPFTALFSESTARAVVTTSDPGGREDDRRVGGRPGHRAGDDGRRRAGRRRPARPAAGRAAGRLDRDPAGAVRDAGGHGRRRPDGRRPHELMPAPIPAEELRAAVDPVRPWLAGEAEQPPRAVVGAAVKTTRPLAGPAGARPVGGAAGAAARRRPVHRGAAAHPGHAAERRRDRRRDLAAAGDRALAWDDAVAEGKVTASGNRADLVRPPPAPPAATGLTALRYRKPGTALRPRLHGSGSRSAGARWCGRSAAEERAGRLHRVDTARRPAGRRRGSRRRR